MEGYNSKIGKLGEDLAGRFLEKNGYQIIDRNFSTCYGEIDLIAERTDLPAATCASRPAGEILFCEVKTRSSLQYGYPELAVSAKKLKHFLQAAKIYLKIKNLQSFWRLDIVSVELLENQEPKIEWFKDVSSGY